MREHEFRGRDKGVIMTNKEIFADWLKKYVKPELLTERFIGVCPMMTAMSCVRLVHAAIMPHGKTVNK